MVSFYVRLAKTHAEHLRRLLVRAVCELHSATFRLSEFSFFVAFGRFSFLNLVLGDLLKRREMLILFGAD